MKLTKEYFQCREQAMRWLDGAPQRRGYDDGVRILARSGYKPHVAVLLRRKGQQAWTEEKLALCLRELVQMYYNPDDPRFSNDVPDTDCLNDEEGDTLTHQEAQAVMGEAAAPGPRMPEAMQALTRAFADAYRQRARLHRRRAQLGESNDSEVRSERRRLSEQMDQLTQYMDRLWNMRKDYERTGRLPATADIRQAAGTTEKNTQAATTHSSATPAAPFSAGGGSDAAQVIAQTDTQRLRTRRRSVVTQLTRKRNMLKYQQNTPKEQPDPMPDCPKRTKIETQIARLTDLLTQIEYELARR